MKWISVKDRLPSMAEESYDGNIILVYHNNFIHEGISWCEKMECIVVGCPGMYKEDVVTHWMKISPPTIQTPSE